MYHCLFSKEINKFRNIDTVLMDYTPELFIHNMIAPHLQINIMK